MSDPPIGFKSSYVVSKSTHLHRRILFVTDEEKGWAITERELELRRTAAVERDGLEIRAFTLINPGNPTGQVLSREELEIICKFCAKYDIVLLADEVYQVSRDRSIRWISHCLSSPIPYSFLEFIHHQKNIYDDRKEFFSARKGARTINRRGMIYFAIKFSPNHYLASPESCHRDARLRKSPIDKLPLDVEGFDRRVRTTGGGDGTAQHRSIRSDAAVQAREFGAVLRCCRADDDESDGPTAPARSG